MSSYRYSNSFKGSVDSKLNKYVANKDYLLCVSSYYNDNMNKITMFSCDNYLNDIKCMKPNYKEISFMYDEDPKNVRDVLLNDKHVKLIKNDLIYATNNDNKMGCMDLCGKEVIPFLYDYICDIGCGLLEKSIDNVIYICNKKNERIICLGKGACVSDSYITNNGYVINYFNEDGDKLSTMVNKEDLLVCRKAFNYRVDLLNQLLLYNYNCVYNLRTGEVKNIELDNNKIKKYHK